MSYVADTLLFTGVTFEDEVPAILDAINTALNAAQGYSVRGFHNVTEHAGGNKAMQVTIFASAINSLRVHAFIRELQKVDWPPLEVDWLQLAVNNEHNSGFGIVEVFRDPAYSEPADVWSMEQEDDF
jgi:hypothetical protein